MSHITTTDLDRILRSAAGEPDLADGGQGVLDFRFDDLGYDSLALLETASQIRVEYGVDLADEAVTALATPRELLDLVNAAATEAG